MSTPIAPAHGSAAELRDDPPRLRVKSVRMLLALGAVLATGCSDDVGTGGYGGAGGGHGGAGGGELGGAGGNAAPAFRLALSIDPFTETLFESGASFSDGATTAASLRDLQSMYLAHGATEVFTRVSTEKAPSGSADDHSEQAALARASLARDLGLPLNPELTLSAHYGDITCQPPPDFSDYPEIVLPGPWGSLTLEEMAAALSQYGALVAADLLATGVTVEVWDLGNEVDLGTAGVAPEGVSCSTPWVAPDGVDSIIGTESLASLFAMSEADRIAWLSTHVWPAEARLLAAVAEGIRSVAPDARFSTHLSQSGSAPFAVAFYQAMFDGGFEPDQLGFSLYPTAHTESDRVAQFKETVDAVQTAFGRPVFIAEVGYPAGPTTGPFSTWTHEIPNYPMNEAGQAAFLRDLTSWLAASGAAGLRPWAPSLFAPGWEGFALFAAEGQLPVRAREGLTAASEGLASPSTEAFHD
ncbi:MAG: glycosyl hydrolase 53 family protein [Polyangiaceae bacterium]